MQIANADRVRIFGTAVVLYGMFMLVGSSVDYYGDGHGIADLCLAIGGFIMAAGGVFVLLRKDRSMADAIGVYAVAYGAFKMFRACGNGGDYWFVPFVLAIPFVILGYRYIKGGADNILSLISWSTAYVFIDIAYLIVAPDAICVMDIVILALFVSVLLSCDASNDAEMGRDAKAAKAEVRGRFDADVDLAKAGMDAIGEGIRNGPDAAKSRFRDSLCEHRQRVDRILASADAVRRNVRLLDDAVAEKKRPCRRIRRFSPTYLY